MSKARREKPLRAPNSARASASPISLGTVPLPYLGVLLALGLVGGLIYWHCLSYPFHFDDGPNIIENQSLRQLSNFLTFSGTRYVGTLSFALNYHFGGLHVFGYHLLNIAIHIANACLVFGVLLLLSRTPAVLDAGLFEEESGTPLARRDRLWFAAFGALLFLVHPIQTQAVVYIVQRFTSLAALFYLLALVGYLKWRLAPKERKGRWGWYAAALLSTVLAMKTKEHAFTAPFALLLVEIGLFWPVRAKSLAWLVPFFLTLPIIPLSLPAVLGEADGILPRETLEVGRLDYLFTQFRVIVTYLRLVVVPIGQSLDHDPTLFRTFWATPVLLSLALLLGLLSVAIGCLFAKKYRLTGVGLLWFFLTLSVESSIIPIKDLMFEHRLYLPLVGLIIALGPLLVRWLRPLRKPAAGVLALSLGTLAVASYQRTSVWRDDLTLWSDVVEKSPSKPRAYQNLGQALYKAQRLPEAAAAYRKALALKPGFADVQFNLGLAYADMKLLPEAMAALEEAVRLQPSHVLAANNLGNAYKNAGRIDDAIRAYRLALEHNPSSSLAHYNLGLVYFDQKRLPEAASAFETTLRLKPDHQNAIINLGAVFSALGELEKARQQYEAFIELRPDFAQARYNLGLLLARQGKDAEALVALELAARMAPDFPDAHQVLGALYEKMARKEDAQTEFERARQLRSKQP